MGVLIRWFCCLVLATILIAAARASDIPAGSNYWATASGSVDFSFDTGGAVALVGVPLAPSTTLGNTDTIIERRLGTSFPPLPSSDTIPIEMIALNLQSAVPITVGGNLYSVIVTLNPSISSTGSMDIAHGATDNPGPTPEGAFQYHSFFDVFVELDFTPIGGAPPLASTNETWSYQSNGSGQWSHQGSANAVGDGMFMDTVLPVSYNVTFIGSGGSVGSQSFLNASAVPEPSTAVLWGLGALVLLRYGQRRKA